MNEPGTAATSTGHAGNAGNGWGGILTTLALAWLAAMLGVAHAHVSGASHITDQLARAALDFPVVVAASLVAGGAVGLATVELLSRRFRSVADRPAVRLATALAGGLVVGAGCAALLLAQYGSTAAIGTGCAAALGGALGGVRPARMIGAALAGTLAWFAVGFLSGLFDNPLRGLFDAGHSLSGQFRAAWWWWLTVSLLGGLVAGLVAYAYLRRAGTGLPWPAYLVAGGGAGAVLLLTEAATRLGGARLLRLAGSISPLDAASLAYQQSDRVKTAMVILFVGAITAIFAFGRTLRPGQA